MLSTAKARAILWLLVREHPPTIDEWSRATHEGTSRALRQSNIIRTSEAGIELTVFGFGVAQGLSYALIPSVELEALWPPKEDYPR